MFLKYCYFLFLSINNFQQIIFSKKFAVYIYSSVFFHWLACFVVRHYNLHSTMQSIYFVIPLITRRKYGTVIFSRCHCSSSDIHYLNYISLYSKCVIKINSPLKVSKFLEVGYLKTLIVDLVVGDIWKFNEIANKKLMRPQYLYSPFLMFFLFPNIFICRRVNTKDLFLPFHLSV